MNYENCVKCGEKLRGANRVRTKPKKCFKCLGQASYCSHNYELSKICKQIMNESKNSKKETEDHTHKFEDSPATKRYNENDYNIALGNLKKKFKKVIFIEVYNSNNYSASWRNEKLLVLIK